MTPALAVRSPAGSRTYAISGTVTIGRAPDNQVLIVAAGASRYHASLTLAEPFCLFLDLGSTNGSRINGQAVEPYVPVAVRTGDAIVIADTTLELVDSGAAATVLGSVEERSRSAPTPVGVRSVAQAAPEAVRGDARSASVPAELAVSYAPAPSPPRPEPSEAHPRTGPAAAGLPDPTGRGAARTTDRSPSPEPVPTSAAGRSPHPLPTLLLAVGVVVAFAGFLMANAVDTKLLQSSYYKGVLDHSNAYQRAYTELTHDPALGGPVNDVVGGIDLLPPEITGVVQQIVPDTVLRTMVEAAIDRVISYLKHHSSLDLSLDITSVVDSSAGSVTTFLSDELFGRPTRDEPSYDAFLADLRQSVAGIKESGRLPDVIPAYETPRNKRPEVSAVITEAGGLNPSNPEDAKVIAEVNDAVADDDIESALKAGMASLIRDSTSEARQGLVEGEFVRQVPENGEERYVLGAPPDVSARIADAIWMIHTASWLAGWGRPVLAILALALLALLVRRYRGNRAAMCRWIGGTLFVGGTLLLMTWLVGSRVMRSQVLSAAFGESSALPASYQSLVRDILANAVSDLAPTFVVPCLIAGIAGLGLLATSVWLIRRGENRLVQSA